MTCYIVAFQAESEATRGKVREVLKSYGTFCPINNTCWAIVTDTSAKDVRDKISNVLDSGDRVFVVRSGTEAAWRNAIGVKNTEWLKKHL
jgi:hypothetical protein